MRVHSIWTYPVKSMIGSLVPTAELDSVGIVGDRRWTLRDAGTGALRGGKKIAAAMQCRAVDDPARPGTAIITLPDGSTTRTDSPEVDARLSSALGAAVHLDARPAPGATPRHREAPPAGADVLAEIRAVMGREETEPLPDFSVFPADVLEYEGPLSAYYDAYPLLIMTTSTMQTLQENLASSVIDIRRFRPSLVIDTGDAPGYPEFSWQNGTKFTLGGAEVQITAPCPRCVMPTREIAPDVPADRDILRYIVRELDQNLGVYATVTRGGRFAVGDAFQQVH